MSEKTKKQVSGWANNKESPNDPTKFFGDFLYHTFFPLLLMSTTPIFVVAIVYTNTHLDGSLARLVSTIFEKGFVEFITTIYQFPTNETWTILGIFVAFEILLMVVIPGKPHKGPVTATGHVPIYKGNGMQAFVVTMAALLAVHYSGLYNIATVYDKMREIITASSMFSIPFCLLLYFKGLIAPSSTDNYVSGNIVMDYYWGIELYPRILGIDLKMLVNCRVGMMSWPILLVCFLMKQLELHGEVSSTMMISVGVQMVYLAKFYWWETGYFDTIDIMHDRFGWMLCWGCLNWVPSLYTNCTFYLVSHRINLDNITAVLVFTAGVFAVLINYAIDEQRQRFRKLDGKVNIWGKPAKFIEASYITTDKKEKKSKLLISGYWGLSRHFNYVAELSAALLWAPPVQTEHILPYAYFIFLVILLVHRAYRDETRCSKKYGKSYEEYKKKVPYLLIPYVF